MTSGTPQHQPGMPGLIEYLARTRVKYVNRAHTASGAGNRRHFQAICYQFQAWIEELRKRT